MKYEKLKEALEDIRFDDLCEDCGCPYYDEINGCEKGGCSTYYDFYKLYEAAIEIKNKIENGTLVELPCTVGDKVYYTWLNESISESKIDVIRIHRNTIAFDTASGITYLLEHLGQSVFLTRNEAEAKLKELRGNE